MQKDGQEESVLLPATRDAHASTRNANQTPAATPLHHRHTSQPDSLSRASTHHRQPLQRKRSSPLSSARRYLPSSTPPHHQRRRSMTWPPQQAPPTNPHPRHRSVQPVTRPEPANFPEHQPGLSLSLSCSFSGTHPRAPSPVGWLVGWPAVRFRTARRRFPCLMA
ncbi:hypothetical protein BC567DRAFT_233418 [Phyllosticta citribraziliensis]